MNANHGGGDDRQHTLDEALRTLLQTVPSGFVAERTRLAGAAVARGDQDAAAALRAVRKPSMAAWALNVLAAHHPERLAELRRLGSALGEAQRTGDASALRSLGGERRALVAALVSSTIAATSDLGVLLSASVVESVRQSVQAASADVDSAERLASGTLTDALSVSGAGWGGGDVSDGPGEGDRAGSAASDEATGAKIDEPGDDRRRRLQERLDAAERDLHDAGSTRAVADARLAEMTARHTELARDRDDLARRLDQLDADLADAVRERELRQRDADRAHRAGEAAEQAVIRLRAALDD